MPIATNSLAKRIVPVESANTRFVLPINAPFLSRAQTGAIFKDAKSPTAVKLYMSWMLSLLMQAEPRPVPRRKDVSPLPGFKSVDQYNKNPEDFLAFVRDATLGLTGL